VQHVGVGGQGEVGAVVDGQQRPVVAGDTAQHGEGGELGARLEALLAQLDDVDPAAQRRVGELGEVALHRAGVGAQVEPGVVQARAAGGARAGGPGRRSRCTHRHDGIP
jgi:hypothetical protein